MEGIVTKSDILQALRIRREYVPKLEDETKGQDFVSKPENDG
jgi:hypothetical protein